MLIGEELQFGMFGMKMKLCSLGVSFDTQLHIFLGLYLKNMYCKALYVILHVVYCKALYISRRIYFLKMRFSLQKKLVCADVICKGNRLVVPTPDDYLKHHVSFPKGQPKTF